MPRTHLIERLNRGLQPGQQLTLISAPAGSGKTTLASSWIHQLKKPVAWLSLDERDNEPERFLLYMIAALQEVHSHIGETALSILQSPQQPAADTLLTLLINDLANLPERAVLVLDDYHVIQELAIHEAVTFLLNNQPRQLHLVIISRVDPAIPLHRLRGSGRMTGIYVKDLRFSASEAAQFLNEIMGLHLSEAEISALERRTEGWAAGLQLAALSMQDLRDTREFVTAFSGDDRYITDYLLVEVIARQPAAIQRFLRKTAIVNRFCALLCEELLDLRLTAEEPLDLPPSQAIIEELDRSNLFVISLDNKREWYRYHQLFADFLRLRLQDLPQNDLRELHRCAAKWYDKNGLTEEAVQHYLEARDYERVASLAERDGMRMIVQGQLRRMREWLAALPEDFIGTRPLLCVCQAWILNVTGQAAAAEPLLQKAESALGAADSVQSRRIRGLVDMIRAYQARRQGDLPRSSALLLEASQSLPAGDRLLRSSVNLNLGFNYAVVGQLARAEAVLEEARADSKSEGAVYINLIAMAVQANNRFAQGKLREATAIYEAAISDGLTRNGGRPFPPAGYAYAGLGQTLYELNELEKAERLLTLAVQAGESIADWSMARRGLFPLVWLKHMEGDTDAARILWQQALDVVHQAGSERVEAQLRAQWARVQLTQAEVSGPALESAAEWALSYRASQPDTASFQEALAQMTLAQAEIAMGQVDAAIWRLEQLAATAAAGHHVNNLIKIRTLQALAHDARGDKTTAVAYLVKALALGEPEGYVRTFIDHGLPIRDLLQEAAARGQAAAYVYRLLTALPARSQSDSTSAASIGSTAVAPLTEPLTEQEGQLVRLMAAGLTNREIADELFLSANTVKVYASRVYSKLGVHRRAAAVARARELGLL